MTMFWRKSLVLLAAMLFSGSLWAQPLNVVASFSILGDIARQIGGDKVAVSTLIGPNQDAHEYQLKPADVKAMRSAKVILVNGLGLESTALMRAANSSGVPVTVASQGILTQTGEEDGKTVTDPHVWNDPLRMPTYAQNVTQALVKADPANAAYYQQRFAAYAKELQSLHQWVEAQIAAVPVEKRKVLTSHDAFGYLGTRYHITFVAPQGVSTEGEASAKTVAALIRQIKTEHFTAVFTENIKNPRLIKQIARETGVNVSGELYSDALSGANGPAASYTAMIRHNITQIRKAWK